MTEILLFIILLGLIFDYTNGFHDAANVVSTVIATRVLTPAVAIIMAGVLNAIGATQVSGVAQTVSSGLIDPHVASQLTVVCALIGAIAWNLVTWALGIPSSSSYALVGGLIGAALFQGGTHLIFWRAIVMKVLIPMTLSPLIGFALAYSAMKGIDAACRVFPKLKGTSLFRHLQIGSAAIVALAHGLNDAQKSMGIITLGLFSAGMIPTTHIPLWVVLLCALMMGLGTAAGGFRIIRTMAYKITHLEPMQGFAAEMSASVVILIASFFGMPISSTQMIVGGIAGVGTARGGENVQWGTGKKLIVAWILTLPGAAAVAFIANKLISIL